MNKSYEKYIVDNDLMDRDHSVLVDLFIDLMNGKNVEYIVYDILKYTLEHFDREEKLMKSVKYTCIGDHREQHMWFSNKLSDVINAGTYKQENVQSLLFLWLTTHINVHDRKLSDFIKLHSENERIS